MRATSAPAPGNAVVPPYWPRAWKPPSIRAISSNSGRALARFCRQRMTAESASAPMTPATAVAVTSPAVTRPDSDSQAPRPTVAAGTRTATRKPVLAATARWRSPARTGAARWRRSCSIRARSCAAVPWARIAGRRRTRSSSARRKAEPSLRRVAAAPSSASSFERPDERRDREQHREGKREPPVVPERVEEGERDAAAGHHRRDHGGADPAGVARQTLARERCRLPGLLAGARAGVQDAPEHVPAQACRDPPLDRRLGPAQCQRQQRTQDGEPGERRRRREDERGPLEADAAEQHQRLIGDPVRKVDLQAQEGCERRALEGGSGNADVERDAQEIESDPGEPEGEDEKCEGGKMKRRGRAPDEAEGIALHG